LDCALQDKTVLKRQGRSAHRRELARSM